MFQILKKTEPFLHLLAFLGEMGICREVSSESMFPAVVELFLIMCPLQRGKEGSVSNVLAFSEAGLRRSPRIKQLSLNRTCSGTFYSTTQPSSKTSQHLHQGQEKESSKLQDVEGTEWDLNRLILLI